MTDGWLKVVDRNRFYNKFADARDGRTFYDVLKYNVERESVKGLIDFFYTIRYKSIYPDRQLSKYHCIITDNEELREVLYNTLMRIHIMFESCMLRDSASQDDFIDELKFIHKQHNQRDMFVIFVNEEQFKGIRCVSNDIIDKTVMIKFRIDDELKDIEVLKTIYKRTNFDASLLKFLCQDVSTSCVVNNKTYRYIPEVFVNDEDVSSVFQVNGFISIELRNYILKLREEYNETDKYPAFTEIYYC